MTNDLKMFKENYSFTKHEVAKIYNVTDTTVRQWIWRGKMNLIY